MHALLKNPVMYRRSRHHIGIVVHRTFDEEEHRIDDREWCPVLKEYRAMNQMEWMLTRVGSAHVVGAQLTGDRAKRCPRT
jgi:hypothetical protein